MLIVLLSIIAVYDLIYGRISNKMILAVTGCGLLYMLIGQGFQGLIQGMLGIVLGLALLVVPYALGGMAAGDVKLMGAVGAFLGPAGVFVAFLYSAVAGGLYALVLILAGRTGGFPRRLWETLKTFYLVGKFHFERPAGTGHAPGIKYGVAIAAGTILYIVLEMAGTGQVVNL